MNEGESGLKTEKYKYVIIGGGTAGHAALVAILQNDPAATVTLSLRSPLPLYILLIYSPGTHASWGAPCTLFSTTSL